MKKQTALLLSLFTLYIHAVAVYPDFYAWQKTCSKLPSYIECATGNRVLNQSALDFTEFSNIYNSFATLVYKSSPALQCNWLNGEMPHDPDTFFVQKIILPAKSQIALRGDLHGDIHSLLLYIQELVELGFLSKTDPFKIAKKDFYMLFLGDYVDRGFYGLEVIYTIMRLKIENPEQVFLIRGNHEDLNINNKYGFAEEIRTKFSQDSDKAMDQIQQFYSSLPVALYAGSPENQSCNYVQCCHGGMEPQYNPQYLLSAQFPHDTGYQLFNPPSYCSTGFMWNDFVVNPEEPSKIDLLSGRNAFGKKDTLALLAEQSSEKNRIVAVFRGHQHSNQMTDMMACILDPENKTDHKGVGKLWKDFTCCNQQLWKGIVCTFLVSPNSCYSQNGTLFDFDAFGILTLAPVFTEWTFQVHRISLPLSNYAREIPSA